MTCRGNILFTFQHFSAVLNIYMASDRRRLWMKSGFVGHFEAVDLESQLKTPARCSNKTNQKSKNTKNTE